MWDRYTGLGDALAVSRLSSVFGAYGKPFQVRGGKSASLADLRGKPLILIGAFSNQWTMDLTGQLRFHFGLDRKAGAQIVRDSQNPENRIGRWCTPGPIGKSRSITPSSPG